MKRKITLLLAALALICLACTGCGKAAAPETLPNFNETPKDTAQAAAPTEPAFSVQPAPEGHPTIGEGDGELLSQKNCQGMVYEISGDGFILLSNRYFDLGDGMTMVEGASPDELSDPGDWPQIKIQYDPGCPFVNATVRFDSEKGAYEGTYKDTTQDSVQPGSLVVVYGEYDEEGILHAQRIYLTIWDRSE